MVFQRGTAYFLTIILGFNLLMRVLLPTESLPTEIGRFFIEDAGLQFIIFAGALLTQAVPEHVHALVGTIAGIELKYIVVDNLVVDITKALPRIRFRVLRGYTTAVADYGFPDERESKVWALRLMYFIGPLATLLLALVFFLIARRSDGPGFLQIALYSVTGFAAFWGFAQFGQVRSAPLTTDGTKRARLLGTRQHVRQSLATSTLIGYMESPLRPRDYPSEVVQEAERRVGSWVQQGRPRARWDDARPAAHLLYYHYVDRGDIALAWQLLELFATAKRPIRMRNQSDGPDLLILHGFHMALWYQNPFAIKKGMKRAQPGSPVKSSTVARGARAATHLIYGDPRRARKEAAKVREQLARTGLPSGADQAEYEWLGLIVERAEVQLGLHPRAPESSPGQANK